MSSTATLVPGIVTNYWWVGGTPPVMFILFHSRRAIKAAAWMVLLRIEGSSPLQRRKILESAARRDL
jgi:hypothetical protein